MHLTDGLVNSSNDLYCPFCGYKNPADSEFCLSCFNKFFVCNICKREISKGEEVFCPYCSAAYHKREFFEWLKVKAYCVNCKKELDLWDFQKFMRNNNTSDVNNLHFCPNCKSFIPNDSKFCIFCGINLNNEKR